jgi:GNAT superfamily N-acetyltransferase
MVKVDWLTDSHDERVGEAAALLAAWEVDELHDPQATPMEEVAQSLFAHPIGLSARLAVAVRDGAVVGAAHLTLDPANLHVAWVRWLVVDRRFRRRGVGSDLVDALVHEVRGARRGALGHAALDSSDTARAFASSLGATPGMAAEQNRLLVADLPSGLLDEWIARAAHGASEYRLVCWNNECPDEYLERCARAYEIMNTAPDAEGEPARVRPERVRAGLEVHAGRGQGFHTTVLHEPTGELVALTELRHVRFRPWHAGQGDTCTDPPHRNRGLGRWVKAHNLRWLLDEHPEVDQVDTWNADVNEPMLNINRAMGFRPIRLWRHWRLLV